jgi:SAM-dependent methyltransferase
MEPKKSSEFRQGCELFLISLLLLFLELACIRWFPAHVLFLTFFTNIVLLACFLGMSVGCLAAKHHRNYLTWTPWLLALAMSAGLAVESWRTNFKPVINEQASPQVVFFGAEDTNPGNMDKFMIPMEVLAGLFFMLIALVMVGPGQELGRAFNRHPNRVLAYTWNIAGSCAGVILFSACSWLELPPLAWFLPVVVGCGWFLLIRGTGKITRHAGPLSFRNLAVGAPLVAVLMLSSWTSGSYSPRPLEQTLAVTALPHGAREAEVERCLVKIGADVKPGQPLLMMKAGRTAFSVPASSAGRIQSLRQPGEKIKSDETLLTIRPPGLGEHLWSPYYRIDFDPAPRLFISVNLIGHQTMVSRQASFAPAYALPHLLHRDAQSLASRTASAFEEVLVIGAGSGNDVSRALEWGAKHVDAVEIDPVIYRLGKEHHPDRPYQDERVFVHLDDGRSFLRRADRRYDLIVYALVDSLVLHSGYSNIRLESYLFTKQAFADVRRLLKPGGLFVMYNGFRQGWIVSRLSRGLEEAFETPPLVLTYPCRETIFPDESFAGMTMLIAGEPASLAPLQEAFRSHPSYHLRNDEVPGPDSPNGFEQNPAPSPFPLASGERGTAEQDRWERFQLATVHQPDKPLRMATDDWPFLYLRRPMIPDLSWRGAAITCGLAILLIFLSSRNPKHEIRNLKTPDSKFSSFGFWISDFLGWRIFFLGAGFMLIETKAVVHMALLFGSTWMVAAVVFLAVLIMILGANLFVLRFRPQRLGLFYAGLLGALILNLLVPLDTLLGLGRGLQGCLACFLLFAPIFFAGVIFGVSLERSPEPGRALGINIAGAMTGGLAEYLSMLVGFHGLVYVAIGFYVLSAVSAKGFIHRSGSIMRPTRRLEAAAKKDRATADV